MQALSIAAENQAAIRSDPLQRLHALANLGELLAEGRGVLPDGLAPTLRDGTLSRDAEAIRSEYLADSVARLAAAEKDFTDAGSALEKVEWQLQDGGSTDGRIYSGAGLWQFWHTPISKMLSGRLQ